MDKKHQAKELISKYHQGTASAEERLLLEQWFLIDLENSDVLPSVASMERAERKISTALSNHIGSEAEPELKKLWPRIRLAVGIAAAVAVVVFGLWFFSYREQASLAGNEGDYVSDVAPGKRGATLTLASGEVIQLSDTKRGVIIGNGKIAYSGSSLDPDPSLRGGTTEQSAEEIASLPRNDGRGKDGEQNLTASTARGQTYEFTLPDGTHVYLNADSKIIFPSQFSGKERKILLEGEAYFVVQHNAKQAFRVESKAANGRGQVVEDIGTEFNINAYEDESSIKTTLVEGSASVSSLPSVSSLRASRSNLNEGKGGAHSVTLTTNQQAALQNGNLVVKQVDVNTATDWKNGDFIFANESLEQIMRRVARWYNVTIRYEGNIDRKQTFSGAVSRSKNISEVLDMLQSTKEVKFKISGNTITVNN